MRFGYARVSTEEQGPDRQADALESAGFERIHLEKASGAKAGPSSRSCSPPSATRARSSWSSSTASRGLPGT